MPFVDEIRCKFLTNHTIQAPVALDIRSPIDLAYECFVKLGLRYICVLRDGKYAGMVSNTQYPINILNLPCKQPSAKHICAVDPQKDIRQVHTRARRGARRPLRGIVDADVGNCTSIETSCALEEEELDLLSIAVVFVLHSHGAFGLNLRRIGF